MKDGRTTKDGKTTVFRNDAAAKVTGRAKYTDDMYFYGMVHVVPVYSNYVHADNLRVETGEAEKMPGVLRVITAKDIPGSVRFGQIDKDYCILAEKKINFEGDVVALVAAETRSQAMEAAAAVKVEADPLTPVIDPEEALTPESPAVREISESNLVNHHKMRRGDAEAQMRECEIVVEEKFSTQAVEHAYMEPESAVCVPRQDGVIEVYGSMQHPFSTRRFVGAILGEPLSNIEVYQPPVGGGFGGKDDTAALVCARAALVARLLGRPAKLTYTREWSIRESYKRHAYRLHYRWGLDKSGRLRAAEIRMVADSGPYLSVTPWVNWRSTAQCCGPYTLDHVKADVLSAATNNPIGGAMRGFGAPQVNFAVEQLADICAEKAGISPLEFRHLNMVQQGGETVTGQVLDTHTVSLGAVMDRVAGEIGFEEKLERCSYGAAHKSADGDSGPAAEAEGDPGPESPDELYGIGLATSYRGSSLGAEGMDFCSAIVNCQFDGSILLETAIHENGQGAESVMMLILAEELGISLDRIRYKRPSTSNIPDGGTTVATRGTIMGGSAVTIAAQKLKKLMAEHLCDELGCSAEEVEFKNDGLESPESRERMSWDEAMGALFLKRVYPYAFGAFQAPDVSWDEEIGQGDAYFTYVYSCQAVELTVNKKSGRVKLRNIVAAHDVGKAVNRAMVLGQMYGGIAQGVGMALFEDLKLEEGRIGAKSLNSYRIPKAMDMPEITGIIVENYDPQSAFGAKGIGEPALEIIAPAIANALYRATGKRFTTLPIHIKPEDLE
ncbi:MAG: xanthine dehydrogenase family protein molybdopterin-binding subunit [Spirochaetaceae bacterium]